MFKFARMHEDAIIPKKGTTGSAGFDLYALTDKVIEAHKWSLVKTGITLQIPTDCYARVAPRSGLTYNKGIDVGAGVIDSDYRSEIGVILFNHSNEDFEIKRGDRIAQLIFEKIYNCEPEVVDYNDLTQTRRGEGGFGSTGVN